eukprot:12289160-Ditylum_brightwellii.AAC.1
MELAATLAPKTYAKSAAKSSSKSTTRKKGNSYVVFLTQTKNVQTWPDHKVKELERENSKLEADYKKEMTELEKMHKSLNQEKLVLEKKISELESD